MAAAALLPNLQYLRVTSPHARAQDMPLTISALRSLQAELHADDVPLTANMLSWTEAQAREHFESGGASSPPLRLLCLHGGGSNSTVMAHQVRHLQRALGGAVCECIDGARDWPLERVPQLLQKMFGAGPYFGWYGVADDGDPARSFLDRVNDPSVAFTYTDVDAALDRVEAAIDERGPFDAICAFSQGAVVATLLTARCLARERAGGAGPSWRRNLLFCGIPPRDARFDALLSPPLDFPATLVHGAQDELMPYGRRLAELYAVPITLEHPDGHRFPAAAGWYDAVAAELRADLCRSIEN